MPAIQPSRVHVGYAGHYWSTYQCIAEEAHTPEDAATSEYWAHVASARQLRVNDVFEVRCEDGSWALDLTVDAVLHKSCRVRVLRDYRAEGPVEQLQPTTGVYVQWKGPANKWCVIRTSDREIIKQGLASKADATREGLEYERLVA
jgi:hypothetical protein